MNANIGQDACTNKVATVGNVGVGYRTLFLNSATYNTAVGVLALANNTTGDTNVGTGQGALFYNTTGDANTATGSEALLHNTSGTFNTAIGARAINSNTSGNNNRAIGYGALRYTIRIGNLAVGIYAGVNITGIGNICIASDGAANENYRIRIADARADRRRRISLLCRRHRGTDRGSTCYVDNARKLGVFLSARHFKTDRHCRHGRCQPSRLGPASRHLPLHTRTG